VTLAADLLGPVDFQFVSLGIRLVPVHPVDACFVEICWPNTEAPPCALCHVLQAFSERFFNDMISDIYFILSVVLMLWLIVASFL